MRKVNISVAKASLSKLVAEVEKKRVTIILCRRGKPAAQLVPIHDPLRQHPLLKKAKILYDPVAPLTYDEWPKRYR